ncbi:hypothetical protein [Streptomyces sp. NPDC048252]|uniref:hypothetical protein n=1 Tax=Streptomyces sp. NPDC048252 TaxID=3154612 RepID=UPI00341C0902
MDGARDPGDELRRVVARVEVKSAPVMDVGHVRGGGLDDVGPPLVSEHDECVRVGAYVVCCVDAGDVQLPVEKEAVAFRVFAAGTPELFGRRAVVGVAGFDVVEGLGCHVLTPLRVSAAVRTRGRWMWRWSMTV